MTEQLDLGPHLDGNALAGPLREIFAVDVTAATSRCAACGLAGALAALHVYASANAPGMVARCPACEEVVLRVVRTPDAAWLDLRGTVALRIPM
ncbi:DUF6510 family protein [Phytohabitans sp. ZYX-F-186]|uniref:DUF6510 family protein n=1 Tax=Phytohabitans maris TaxID=3071409 RepID=A0ABU0ZQ74_9ACTN|nr:DUF6510 family protein [Phytohabitans sp. ZYX-F-186]MDQ7908582.1 DUF6510 family protein [Phytohabitans sp. ZYX-F-186]